MLIGLVFISAERGAETSIMLASDPAYQPITGRYFDQGKEASAASIALMLRRKKRSERESRAVEP